MAIHDIEAADITSYELRQLEHEIGLRIHDDTPLSMGSVAIDDSDARVLEDAVDLIQMDDHDYRLSLHITDPTVVSPSSWLIARAAAVDGSSAELSRTDLFPPQVRHLVSLGEAVVRPTVSMHMRFTYRGPDMTRPVSMQLDGFERTRTKLRQRLSFLDNSQSLEGIDAAFSRDVVQIGEQFSMDYRRYSPLNRAMGAIVMLAGGTLNELMTQADIPHETTNYGTSNFPTARFTSPFRNFRDFMNLYNAVSVLIDDAPPRFSAEKIQWQHDKKFGV